jgi:hypothetical protein
MGEKVSDPKRHHFVPKLLLRPWLVDDELRGYWWHPKREELIPKIKGLDAFCFQMNLLTLISAGRRRYDIEKIFFGDIDDKGAKARDQLLSNGISSLTVDQRCDFARLLISLDVRRPYVVNKLLREDGPEYFKGELDCDPEILAAFNAEGINDRPSAYAEQKLGMCFEDRALRIIQRLVDNRRVGVVLINARWDVLHVGQYDGKFVLSDRPLIRINPFDKPGASWILPLTPKAVFVAFNHIENLNRIRHLSRPRLVKEVNRSSVQQADRFVFTTDRSDVAWIGNHLRKPAT